MQPLLSRLNALYDVYQTLSRREQKSIMIGAVITTALLVWFLIVSPLFEANMDLEKDINRLQSNLSWMQQHQQEIFRLRNPKDKKSSNKSVLQILESSLSIRNIKAYEPSISQQTNRITVAFKQVPFNDTIFWLDKLYQQHQVYPAQISIDRHQEDGYITTSMWFDLAI